MNAIIGTRFSLINKGIPEVIKYTKLPFAHRLKNMVQTPYLLLLCDKHGNKTIGKTQWEILLEIFIISNCMMFISQYLQNIYTC